MDWSLTHERLTLLPDGVALWDNKPVELTARQFLATYCLVGHAGLNCSFKQLDMFVGPRSTRTLTGKNLDRNIRSIKKRVQEQFQMVDPAFAEIKTIEKFGYRWGSAIQPPPGSLYAKDKLCRGALTAYSLISQIFWDGSPIDLTPMQVKLVIELVRHQGCVLTYRRLYDVAWREGFFGGDEDGCKMNVKTHIKRIRQAFHVVDPSFDKITNVAAQGYQWIAG